MTKALPLDRRTLLKVKNRIAGKCSCDQCDPGGFLRDLRSWLAAEADRSIEKRRTKKAGKR